MNGARYLAMSFFESSIPDHLKQFESEEKLSERRTEICRISSEMVECLEEFHKATNKVHRDVKPENFRIHEGSVKLIDFGSVFNFSKDGNHIDNNVGFSFKGTLCFASVKSLELNTHSRRDDMEAVGYSILSLMSLISEKIMPWEQLRVEEGPIMKVILD